MGKAEDGQPLPGSENAQSTSPREGCINGCCSSCCRLRKLVTLRCVFALVLGFTVLLSSVFWLPFFHLGHQKDLDLDYEGHDIVASFLLKKPASFLKDYMPQLEDAIFDEMSFASTKVDIMSLEPASAGSNITKVVFDVVADLTTQSLIRSSFASLISNQSFLHLTESLFGDPLSFDVLKFRGGITATPDQKAFLMQSVQILFNFTLNFSIDQIMDNFNELTNQLETGLNLATYENLYIRLTNLKGSTVAPPTTIQAQVLLAVGLNPSSMRLKQLARTITNSHSKNLGLNHTVFGRVKQIRLSSILQHSLDGDGSSPSPSPSPSPYPISKSHHHHHHCANLSLGASPSPSPSPSPSMVGGGFSIRHRSPLPAPVPAPTPKIVQTPRCQFDNGNRFPRKHSKPSDSTPSTAPTYAPVASPANQHRPTQKISPTPAKSQTLPDVNHARPPEMMPLISPAASPSSAGLLSTNRVLLLFIFLGLHLLL